MGDKKETEILGKKQKPKNKKANQKKRNPRLAELTVRNELSISEIKSFEEQLMLLLEMVLLSGNDRTVSNRAKTIQKVSEKKP